MTRLRGRAQRGQRVHGAAPHEHWNSTTVIGAMRMDGSTACMAIEGATDTEVFATYVREVLCPILRVGDLLVMDNLSPHKSEPTLALIRQTGADVLFLPAYSPDLNPIEQMWSKVKNTLRSLEARTRDSLLEAIGQALAGITPQDTRNWFGHCGYNFI
jgi:transposase